MQVTVLGHSLAHNQATITCDHVLASEAIGLVSHDHDGTIQVLCGRSGHDLAHVKLVALHSLVDRITAAGVPDLATGQSAAHLSTGWRIVALPPEEEEA